MRLLKAFTAVSALFVLPIFFAQIFAPALYAQTHQAIAQSIEQKNYAAARAELENLRRSDPKSFEANNYDYLLARAAEESGDAAAAMAHYQSVASRNSILKEYALRHLAEIARATGNLPLERAFLQEFLLFAPESLFARAAKDRVARSFYESRDFGAAIRLLSAAPASSGSSQSSEKMAPNQPPASAGNDAASRENLVLLGQSYLQNNQTREAREIFARLIGNLPNPAQPDDYALAGALALDLLDGGAENFGASAPALPDFEHLRRAQIYHFNRDYPNARLHYQAIIKNHPQSGSVPDAIYQIGRGSAQTGEFVEAISWFERVQEQYPDHPVAKDALSQAASAYARVNKPREAITRYQRFIEKYPDAENLDRAYLNIVDVLRDSGENAEALKQTAKTQEVFRGKTPEAIALFAQIRIRFVQNDWQNALVDLDKLLTLPDLGARATGGTNKPEALFMKAFALENAERFPEAIDAYLAISDGRGEYYGWRATERLRALANHDKAQMHVVRKLGELTINIETRTPDAQRKAAQAALRLNESPPIRARMLEIVKKSYAALPEYQKTPNFKLLELGRREVVSSEKRQTIAGNYHQAVADELLFLRLYDEATPELEAAERRRKSEAETRGRAGDGDKSDAAASEMKTSETKTGETNPKSKIQNPKSVDFAYTLAVYYKRGEMAHRSVAFIEPFWRGVPADYEIELMPTDQVELLYPAPYADALLRSAPEREVDARFLLSIMRQESRYRPDVKSYAAARGLMQFISTTADRIARQLGRKDFRQDELYHPPTAVLFGAQYASNLFKEFPAQPAAVAASYNGGEDNVRRWVARSKSTAPDRYVPEIVFSQSKDYIYKVMANYRVYRQFYDENLKLK